MDNALFVEFKQELQRNSAKLPARFNILYKHRLWFLM